MEQFPGWEKFELIHDWPQALRESTKENLIVFIGDVGLGETGDYLRSQGYKVIGGSRFGDRAEDDRTFATDFMKRFMKIPETFSFESFEEAINFLKQQDKEAKFVWKPNDADVPKEYTYVAKNIEDMLSFIKDIQSQWAWKESFQLQAVVEGTEVDFDCYFNGNEFIESTFLLYFENKALMDENRGPATGGAIATAFRPLELGIFWDILQKVAPYLKKAEYKGQVAVNSIVSDKDKEPYFLEFCIRCGYPSLPIEISLLEDGGKSIHDLCLAMIEGKNPPDLFPLKKMGVTASIFVPPAPNADPWMMTGTKGQPISWDKKYDNYFYPYYIMHDEKKGMVLAGIQSWIGQVTCVAGSLQGACDMLYDSYMPTFKCKNYMIRGDLGVDAKKRILKLKELGLL